MDDLLGEVAQFGESLLLTKSLQRKYEERGVTKDVVVVKEERQIEVQDVIHRSMSVSPITGRVIHLTHQNILRQTDIMETPSQEKEKQRGKLVDMDLNSKLPLESSGVLDMVFDSEAQRMYCLTKKFMLEVFDMNSKSNQAMKRLRLLGEEQDGVEETMASCY